MICLMICGISNVVSSGWVKFDCSNVLIVGLLSLMIVVCVVG